MKEKADQKSDKDPAVEADADPAADRLGFDATTNFSILGWIWDRFSKKRDRLRQVDLK